MPTTILGLLLSVCNCLCLLTPENSAAAVIGIPAVDQGTAMGTAFVMVVIAVLAERDCVRSAVIGFVDTFTAAGTDCGLLVKAGRAKQFILKWD